jgi:hypothetical protein
MEDYENNMFAARFGAFLAKRCYIWKSGAPGEGAVKGTHDDP